MRKPKPIRIGANRLDFHGFSGSIWKIGSFNLVFHCSGYPGVNYHRCGKPSSPKKKHLEWWISQIDVVFWTVNHLLMDFLRGVADKRLQTLISWLVIFAGTPQKKLRLQRDQLLKIRLRGLCHCFPVVSEAVTNQQATMGGSLKKI